MYVYNYNNSVQLILIFFMLIFRTQLGWGYDLDVLPNIQM